MSVVAVSFGHYIMIVHAISLCLVVDIVFYRVKFSKNEIIIRYIIRKNKVFKRQDLCKYEIRGVSIGKYMYLYFNSHRRIYLLAPGKLTEFEEELQRYLPEKESAQEPGNE
jgi:hypothetical protein